MTPVYISATVQDSGKTSVSLGLMQLLRDRGADPGYIKPVGQHYVPYMNRNVDEDAVLVHKVFRDQDDPYYLSPIAIERGFTARFIHNPDVHPLETRILDCMEHLQARHEYLIVEGTGHAGVGSCFGLSNARVAELIGAKVIIVTAGGIGKPIDEVAVNLALFRQHHVEVLGVILNKVLPDKLDKVRATAGRGLELLGTRLLGAVPYERSLTFFTVGQLVEEFGYRVLWGERALSNHIEVTVVAAMEPKHVIRYIREHTLIIAPGDRIDNILVSILTMDHSFKGTGGLILTGGMEPHPDIVPLLQTHPIPVLLSQEDTFTVSSRMASLGFKIREWDTDKIEKLHALVRDHVATDEILAALEQPA